MKPNNVDSDSKFRSSGLNTGVEVNIRPANISAEVNNWVYTRYSRPFSTFEDARVHNTLASSAFDFTHDGSCTFTHQQKWFLNALKSANPPTEEPPTSGSLSFHTYGNLSKYSGGLTIRSKTFAGTLHVRDDSSFSLLIKKELWNGGKPLASLCQYLFPQDDYGRWVQGLRREQERRQNALAHTEAHPHASTASPADAHTHAREHTHPHSHSHSHVHGDFCGQRGYGLSPHDIATLPASDTPLVDTSDPYEIRSMTSILRTPRFFSNLLSRAPVWQQPLLTAKMAVFGASDGELRTAVGCHYSNGARDTHVQLGWSPDRVTHFQYARELLPRTYLTLNILRFPPLIAPISGVRAQPLHTHFSVNVAKTFTKTAWEDIPDPNYVKIPDLELAETQKMADQALAHAQSLLEAIPRPAPTTAPTTVLTHTDSPVIDSSASLTSTPPSLPIETIVNSAETTISTTETALVIAPESLTPAEPIIPTISVPVERDWLTVGMGVSSTGTAEAAAELHITQSLRVGVNVLVDKKMGFISGWSLWKD